MKIRFAILDDISTPRESECQFLAMLLIFGALAGNAQGNLIQGDAGNVRFTLLSGTTNPESRNNNNLPIECLASPKKYDI